MEDNLARYEVQVADRFGWRTIGLLRVEAEADRMAAAYQRKDWVRAVRIVELETV